MLNVDDLHFAYDGDHILRGLSIKVGDREVVGVVGPNGSGKTTLFRLMTGVLRPMSGRVLIEGVDMADLKPVERARLVAVVAQNPELPAGFTVHDLVTMGRNPHLKLLQWESRRDLEVVLRVMELTDTLPLADRLVGTLSGGERQRCLVALALAQEAPVLLMDEPTSSLDLAGQTEVMDLVREVQGNRGGAVVIAMHDLTLAAQYCDRIVMVHEGRAYAAGRPGQVLTVENIRVVYGVEAEVLRHPRSGTPVVLPVSRTVRQSVG